MNQQREEKGACEVTLIEKLLSVDRDYRTCEEIQWTEDGTCIGRRFIPYGYMMHEAAVRIAELEAQNVKLRQIEFRTAMERDTAIEAYAALSADLKEYDNWHVRLASSELRVKELEAQLAELREGKMSDSIIERLRLGNGTSPDHNLLLEAAAKIEQLYAILKVDSQIDKQRKEHIAELEADNVRLKRKMLVLCVDHEKQPSQEENGE